MQRARIPLQLAKNIVSNSRMSVSTIEKADRPKSIVYEQGAKIRGKTEGPTTGASADARIERVDKLNEREADKTSRKPEIKVDHRKDKKLPGGDNQGERVEVDKPIVKTEDRGRYVMRPEDADVSGQKPIKQPSRF